MLVVESLGTPAGHPEELSYRLFGIMDEASSSAPYTLRPSGQ
jgi:hypothetical protein